MKKAFHFYRDGFRRMTVGRTLWKIIVIKVAFIFLVLRIFVFPDFLKTQFPDDRQRADHVFEQMRNAAAVK